MTASPKPTIAVSPLSAEYIEGVHTAALQAIESRAMRKAWPLSYSGSPVATAMLCEEIVRLRAERAKMTDAITALDGAAAPQLLSALRLCLFDLEHTHAEVNAVSGHRIRTSTIPVACAAIAKAEAASPYIDISLSGAAQ